MKFEKHSKLWLMLKSFASVYLLYIFLLLSKIFLKFLNSCERVKFPACCKHWPLKKKVFFHFWWYYDSFKSTWTHPSLTIRNFTSETSLEFQRLGLWAFTAEGPSSMPGWELRSCKPHGQKKNFISFHFFWIHISVSTSPNKILICFMLENLLLSAIKISI